MDWRGTARRLRAEWGERSGAHERSFARLDGTRAAILTYHRILPRERARAGFVEAGMYVTPGTFASQLRWLSEDFEVLPLAAVVKAFREGTPLPPRACALTFDDGWRDNFEFAFPLLRERDLPATIFLVTDRVGSHGSFWPDEVCARLGSLSPEAARGTVNRLLDRDVHGDPSQELLAELKTRAAPARESILESLRRSGPPPTTERELLDWSEIETMVAGRIDFESHSRSHAILTGIDLQSAHGELRDSQRALESRGLGAARVIAYPSGAFDRSVCEAAEAAGYRAAVTMRKGLASRGSNPFELERIPIHDDISRSRSEFRRRLTGRL